MSIFANPIVADAGDRVQGLMKPWSVVTVPSHRGECAIRQSAGVAGGDREDPAP